MTGHSRPVITGRTISYFLKGHYVALGSYTWFYYVKPGCTHDGYGLRPYPRTLKSLDGLRPSRLFNVMK